MKGRIVIASIGAGVIFIVVAVITGKIPVLGLILALLLMLSAVAAICWSFLIDERSEAKDWLSALRIPGSVLAVLLLFVVIAFVGRETEAERQARLAAVETAIEEAATLHADGKSAAAIEMLQDAWFDAEPERGKEVGRIKTQYATEAVAKLIDEAEAARGSGDRVKAIGLLSQATSWDFRDASNQEQAEALLTEIKRADKQIAGSQRDVKPKTDDRPIGTTLKSLKSSIPVLRKNTPKVDVHPEIGLPRYMWTITLRDMGIVRNPNQKSVRLFVVTNQSGEIVRIDGIILLPLNDDEHLYASTLMANAVTHYATGMPITDVKDLFMRTARSKGIENATHGNIRIGTTLMRAKDGGVMTFHITRAE